VQISGHATYQVNQSYSQLCLAVSVLARTVLHYLEEQRWVENIIINDGFLAWQLIDSSNTNVHTAMDILVLGLTDIASEWPEQLSIVLQEE
jgi:uncharacterized protein YsxB (DUF464 family)